MRPVLALLLAFAAGLPPSAGARPVGPVAPQGGLLAPGEAPPPPAPQFPEPPLLPAAEPPAPAPAVAQPVPPPPPATPHGSWARRLRVWVNAGTTWAYGNSYFNLGAGAGYEVIAGLAPVLDLSWSIGPSPMVFGLKPGLDWFVPLPGRVRPYVGAYYAHWFVGGGFPDQDAWGARGGLSFAQAGPATFSLGVAYEKVFTNCTGSCEYWIPQVSAGFSL